jgi:hypothetical protein
VTLSRAPAYDLIPTLWYQVKSRAQKADGQKADINNPLNQKAEMPKTDTV